MSANIWDGTSSFPDFFTKIKKEKNIKNYNIIILDWLKNLL